MVDLLEIQGLFPNILQEGFSAYKASLNVSSGTIITNWTVTSPFFSSSSLNASSGVYAVPVTGVYATQATISYTTNSAITTPLGANTNPTFVIRRSSPTTTDLISGQLPIFNYANVLVISLRTILGSGTVTLSGIVRLTEADTVGLYYEADGMTQSLTLQDILWTAYRLV